MPIAEAGPLDELGRARVDLLRAEIAFAQNRGGDAPLLLLQAARKLEPLDVRLARDTYLEAWGAALFAGQLASAGGSLLDVSRAVATAPGPAGSALPRDLLLDGLALIFTDGRAAAAPAAAARGRRVRERARPPRRRCCGGVGWRRGRRTGSGTTTAASRSPTRAVQLARDSGALEVLAVADNVCGQAAACGGDFELAALLVAEVEAVKEATGTRIAPYAAIALAGLRGREAEASELIDGVIERSHRRRPGDRRPVRALGERPCS